MNMHQLYQRRDSSCSFSECDASSNGSSSDFDDESFCKDSVIGPTSKRPAATRRALTKALVSSNDSESDDDESFCNDSVAKRRQPMRTNRPAVSVTTMTESESEDDDDSYCCDSVQIIRKCGQNKTPRIMPTTTGPSPKLSSTKSDLSSPWRRPPPPTLLQLSKSLYVSSLSLNGSSAHSRSPLEHDWNIHAMEDEDDVSEFSDGFFDDDCLCKDKQTASASIDLSHMQQQQTYIGPRAA